MGLDPKTMVQRFTFTFQADDITSTTNGEFRIEGACACSAASKNKGEIWAFHASALIRNVKVYRGDAETANAQYIDIQYIAKEYASIPEIERGNHSIDEPSPPDQWFVKFPAAGPQDLNQPPPIYTPTGGGGGLDWPPISPPATGEGVDVNANVTEEFATKLSRLLVTNRIDLLPGSIYKFHIIINRIKNANANQILKVRINPSLASIVPSFDGTISTTEVQTSIEWEFDTTGISAVDLRGVRFRIDMYEENIDIDDAADVYVSDINILGRIKELPINTIFRYDGEAWDDALTKLSNDNGITGGHPYALVENYEANSNIQRLYCLSDGDVYVWGIGAQDPYGSTVASRIVVSW